MHFLNKASADTAPTGPAPTKITRSPCCIIRSRRSHSYEFRSYCAAPDHSNCLSDFRNLEHRSVEQLLGGDLAIDQALLRAVLRQPRELAHVLLEALRREVVPHHRHAFLRFPAQPGDRHLQ